MSTDLFLSSRTARLIHFLMRWQASKYVHWVTGSSSSGFKLLFRDARDVRRIKSKMSSDGVKFQDLPYREMEKLRQVGASYVNTPTWIYPVQRHCESTLPFQTAVVLFCSFAETWSRPFHWWCYPFLPWPTTWFLFWCELPNTKHVSIAATTLWLIFRKAMWNIWSILKSVSVNTTLCLAWYCNILPCCPLSFLLSHHSALPHSTTILSVHAQVLFPPPAADPSFLDSQTAGRVSGLVPFPQGLVPPACAQRAPEHKLSGQRGAAAGSPQGLVC